MDELKPGLSAYAIDPKAVTDPKAITDSLLPLLEKAEKVVPKDMRQNTPVKVGTTAGLRQLGVDASKRILQAVQLMLKVKSSFQSNADWVTVLDGTQEGAYQWVLMDFPQWTMTLPNRREESVMKRTTLVANTSNMHVASNETLMSRSVGRADSGSKIVGSAKAESVESGEKTSNMNILAQEQSAYPYLSCNAVLCSGHEASKDEVKQEGKSFPTDEFWIHKLSSCKWD
ncbi:apyrase 2, partial [Tanacetum coccineum]